MDKLLSKLKKVQKEIIDECTKNGIRANIVIAAQIGDKSYYPYLDNSVEIKKSLKNIQ